MASLPSASDLGVSSRILSACLGSTAVAFAVTPLDVARVRMQAATLSWLPQSRASVCGLNLSQFHTRGNSLACVSNSGSFWNHLLRPFGLSPIGFSCYNLGAPAGTVETLRLISSEGGMSGLYAGLPATLLIGIPMNVIYFATYEGFRDQLRLQLGRFSGIAPIIAGGVSRALAVTACAPLEVLRTRIQAGHALESSVQARPSLARMLAEIVQKEGHSVMFRGLQSTLWRDVPFSAFYWCGVEGLRASLIRNGWWKDQPAQAPFVSVVASSTAGALAAFCTTPFDVVKTRSQVEVVDSARSRAPGMWSAGFRIFHQEGISVLFAGAAPRVFRVAPACAIMLGTYETMKLTFGSGTQ